MTRRRQTRSEAPRVTRPARARILPFEPASATLGPPRPTSSRRPTGLVATMSIDAAEVARLVARDLAEAGVRGLIDEQRRTSGTLPEGDPLRCGAPRRHAPYAPCRSAGLLANGRCRWHQGPQRTA